MKHSHKMSLTQNQLLLWTGQQLNPEAPLYNMAMTYEIKTTISIPHFKLAFEKLVEKSDALRSVFETEEGKLIQHYLSEIEFETTVKDFSNESNPTAVASDWINERVSSLFDLSKCLFDCVLIKLAEDHFIWYLNQHHLITDGWSTSIIFSTISDFYSKAVQGNLEEVKDLPSYQDFVTHTQIIKENPKTKNIDQYWEEVQKTFPPSQAVPYGKREVLLNTSSNRVLVKLGKDRCEKLLELANSSSIRSWTLDLTLYNIFLTSLFAYIYRVTDQKSIVIGSPTHNRTSKDFKNTVGFFVETFPLATEIEEEETFLSLLKKIQISSNSFIKYAQAGVSTPEMNRHFNVFFNYINSKNTTFNGAPVNTSWIHPGHHDPRHHFRLHVHDFDNSGELQLYFDFNTVVFNDQKQKEATSHFLKLLDAFIEDQNIDLKDVNLITESELSQIEQWNNTFVQYPENETLLSKFKTQVQKAPNNMALVFKGETLTYKELDERSNQVANFLIERKINTNDIIAISLDRSLEMMIYIYGIIKAGAAYLSIDTHTPLERLNFILNDSKAKLLFYNHDRIVGDTLDIIDSFKLETIESEIASLQVTTPEVLVVPDDLAYIIYTSGSTGEPKGVKSHHKGICNRLNWMNDDYPITTKDTLLQKTPITFDVSLWELFWPLQQGAKLVIEIPEGHKDPERLIKTIQDYRVTTVHFVPSMLNVFMETNGVENCLSLEKVFCSGEALTTAIVAKTFDQLDVELYNLYGPTEAAVDVTSWHCQKENLTSVIPIGKPVANTHIYILDQNQNPLPIGVPGELYIGGSQVANGYLNRSELTKKHFLKDVFTSNPDGKMYKTGDLVRYDDNGVIEYLGRIDHQVKVRGLRIELGEIEKNIEKNSAINQAVVIVDEQQNLIAYYTGEKQDDNVIIGELESRLPAYMVPSYFMHLERFEFLSSGKINRKKLIGYKVPTKEYKESTLTEPQTEIEEIVLNVWKEVLGIDRIGIYEHFIRIGGNSLLAISITSRLKNILELDLSITDMFNYPTVKVYSEQVEKKIIELLQESD